MTAPRIAAGLALVGVFLSPGCDQDAARSLGVGTPGQAVTAPRVTLRLSGNLEGYLMPCGCASGQLGGLARRGFRNKLDKRNVDLFLEGGNLIKEAGELDLMKLLTILEVLDEQDYAAIGLGPKDLELGMDELGGSLQSFPNLPTLAADLRAKDGKAWAMDGAPIVRPFLEKKLEQVTVRITSLVMKLPAGAKKTFQLLEPGKAWQAAMADVAADSYRILLVHADGDAIKKLQLSPKPDLIVGVNHDYVEPPTRADSSDGVPLVYTGEHGRILVDVTLTRGPDGPTITRYKTVQLKGSQTSPDAMRDKVASAMILGHRETVKEMNLLEELAGKKLLPKGLKYVGAETCEACHEQTSDKCGKHAHSHAWQTLIDAEKSEKWPVTHYPECVSCHVVGYGYRSGFVSIDKTPELKDVTCENCHGPGSAHAEDETVKMQPVTVKTCTICHNFEHSPKFDYSSYWKKIEHGLEK